MATKTQGTILKWNAVPVGEVMGVSGLSSPSTKINITSFADTVMKYRPGRRKVGEFTFEINLNLDDTSQAALETDRQAGTARAVLLTVPSGATADVAFTGVITNITMSAAGDDIWKSQITIKPTTIPQRS